MGWWETYLGEEGFEGMYCQFDGLHSLKDYGGAILGMLAMEYPIPHLKITHVVAVDEFGVVDRADNAPDHVALSDYVQSRIPDGVAFLWCITCATVLGVAAGTRALAAGLRR